jgi:hypothetical protein
LNDTTITWSEVEYTTPLPSEISMAEPHPAFPSIGASSSRSSTGLLKGSDVSQILSQTKPLTGVRHQLIPAFERLIAQSDPDTTDSILCQPDHDLAARSDDNLTLLAVPLVYVLWVILM